MWSHCSGNCATCGHVAAGGLFCAPDGKTPSPRQRHGGQAGAVAVEAWQCMPLPDALSFEDGSVLACSGGTAYQAVRGAAVAGGEKVLVLGAGPLGLQVAQVALLLGADVIVVDANPGRLDLAGTLGVRDLILSGQEQVLEAARSLTGGFGADVVFEATGSRDAQRDSVHLARVGGRICLLGFSADGVDTAVLRPGSLITRQLTVIGSFVYPPTRFQEITAFAAASGWRPSAVVTDRFPLDSAAHAYEVAAERSRGKVLLVSEA